MSDDDVQRGLLDTNVIVLRRWIDPAELPEQMAISAITLAELSAGPHLVRSNKEQDEYDESPERARRIDVLQRAENEFDPIRLRPRPRGHTAGLPPPSSRRLGGHDAEWLI